MFIEEKSHLKLIDVGRKTCRSGRGGFEVVSQEVLGLIAACLCRAEREWVYEKHRTRGITLWNSNRDEMYLRGAMMRTCREGSFADIICCNSILNSLKMSASV